MFFSVITRLLICSFWLARLDARVEVWHDIREDPSIINKDVNVGKLLLYLACSRLHCIMSAGSYWSHKLKRRAQRSVTSPSSIGAQVLETKLA